jgi:hypothetical protein
MEGEEGRSPKRRRTDIDKTGPYTLRPLVEAIQLVADEGDGVAEITSVELWGQ